MSERDQKRKKRRQRKIEESVHLQYKQPKEVEWRKNIEESTIEKTTTTTTTTTATAATTATAITTTTTTATKNGCCRYPGKKIEGKRKLSKKINRERKKERERERERGKKRKKAVRMLCEGIQVMTLKMK